MARRRKQYSGTERDPEFSREGSQRGMFGRATSFVLGVFVLVLAAAVIVPIAPEYQKLRRIESELVDTHDEEGELLRKRRQFELESKSLSDNLDYLEYRARDIGPYYRPGEAVIKIEE